MIVIAALCTSVYLICRSIVQLPQLTEAD